METMEPQEQTSAFSRLKQLKEIISESLAEAKNAVCSDNSELSVFIQQVLIAKDLVVIEEETLTLQMLAEAIKENKVPNSDQVVVFKKSKEDSFVVSFSFAKDKQLLPESDNKHVAILSKSIDEPLVKLFGDKDLIVLR